jgi:hypothetical protein
VTTGDLAALRLAERGEKARRWMIEQAAQTMIFTKVITNEAIQALS